MCEVGPPDNKLVQIWSYVAAMIDETGKVATLCGVYDGVVVNAEHVAAADALFLVAFLPHVCDHLRMDDASTLGFNIFSSTKGKTELTLSLMILQFRVLATWGQQAPTFLHACTARRKKGIDLQFLSLVYIHVLNYTNNQAEEEYSHYHCMTVAIKLFISRVTQEKIRCAVYN